MGAYDSGDSSSEKTPFVMSPSGPESKLRASAAAEVLSSTRQDLSTGLMPSLLLRMVSEEALKRALSRTSRSLRQPPPDPLQSPPKREIRKMPKWTFGGQSLAVMVVLGPEL